MPTFGAVSDAGFENARGSRTNFRQILAILVVAWSESVREQPVKNRTETALDKGFERSLETEVRADCRAEYLLISHPLAVLRQATYALGVDNPRITSERSDHDHL